MNSGVTYRTICTYEEVVLSTFSSHGEAFFCMSVLESRGTRLVCYPRHYYVDTYASKSTSSCHINMFKLTIS